MVETRGAEAAAVGVVAAAAREVGVVGVTVAAGSSALLEAWACRTSTEGGHRSKRRPLPSQ